MRLKAHLAWPLLGSRGATKKTWSAEEVLAQLDAGAEALCLTGDASQGQQVDVDFLKEIAPALGGNRTVRWLQLDRNGLGDDAADVLARVLVENQGLTLLDLDFNQIGDRGICFLADALEANQSLQQLDLHCNAVRAAGAVRLGRALKVNSTLRSLSLHGNPIRDSGAKALAAALVSNGTLRTLSLHGARVTDEGARHLALALEENNSLRELCLGHNFIADDGAAYFAQMLEVNSVLQELRMEANAIGDLGGSRLAQALELNLGLSELWLIENPIGPPAFELFADALRRNRRLTRLGLTARVSNDAGVEQGLKNLQQNLRVKKAAKAVVDGSQRLSLQDEDLGEDGVANLAEAIEGSATLLGLTLEKCQIGDKGAARIAEALEKNSSLLEVSLAGNAIGDEGASRLREVLDRNDTIYELDLGDNPLGKELTETLEMSCSRMMVDTHRLDDDLPEGPPLTGCAPSFVASADAEPVRVNTGSAVLGLEQAPPPEAFARNWHSGACRPPSCSHAEVVGDRLPPELLDNMSRPRPAMTSAVDEESPLPPDLVDDASVTSGATPPSERGSSAWRKASSHGAATTAAADDESPSPLVLEGDAPVASGARTQRARRRRHAQPRTDPSPELPPELADGELRTCSKVASGGAEPPRAEGAGSSWRRAVARPGDSMDPESIRTELAEGDALDPEGTPPVDVDEETSIWQMGRPPPTQQISRTTCII